MPQNRDKTRGRQGGAKSAPARSSAEKHAPEKQASPKPAPDSLQAREYRDEKGEIHHHTKPYMEQHRDRDR